MGLIIWNLDHSKEHRGRTAGSNATDTRTNLADQRWINNMPKGLDNFEIA
jgi:hypothetical protein